MSYNSLTLQFGLDFAQLMSNENTWPEPSLALTRLHFLCDPVSL